MTTNYRRHGRLYLPDYYRRDSIISIIDPLKMPPLPDVGRLPPLQCAISVDNSGITSNGSSPASLTLNTMAIGATANFLVVWILTGSTSGNDYSTALTVDGASIFGNVLWNVSDSNWTRCKAFYQLNPTVTTPSIVVTFNSGGLNPTNAAMIVASFIGVDVAGTPYGTAVTASGTGTAPATGNITSAVGEMVIAGISSDSEGLLTEGGTLIQEVQNVGSDTSMGAQRYDGAATINATWTTNSNFYSVGGVSLKPSGGGGGGPTFTGLGMLAAMQN